MSNLWYKKGISCVLALVLAGLLMTTPLTGIIELSFMPSSESKVEFELGQPPQGQRISEMNSDTLDWEEMTPPFSPGPTADPAMTYDVESDLVVMFGGSFWETIGPSDYIGYNETWSYDYNTNTWTNMSPPVSPPVRTTTEIVYDVESDIIILFGGHTTNVFGANHHYNDTWAYDINTNTWTEMNPSVAPQARRWHSITYDSESDRVILFGGINGTFNRLNDTWTYDYNANTWSMMNPDEGPSSRAGSVLVYDEASEVSILFGGHIGGDAYFGYRSDTWVYNSSEDAWTEMSPSYHPSRSLGMTAVFDSYANRIIMFGGQGYSPSYNVTWSYDLSFNTWFEMNTPNAPPERFYHGLAFDSESNRTILFGGENWTSSFNDTWAYRYQINPSPAPDNLEISVSDRDLVLTWEAPIAHPETPILGYNVHRRTESQDYNLLAELVNALTYTDTTITAGIRYYYLVRAVTSVGEGDESDVVSGFVESVEPFDDDTWTFIAYGDTRDNADAAVSAMHDIIITQYLEFDPEMILHTGDLVREGGEPWQWPLFNESISPIYDWDPDMKFYSAVGNHERYIFEGSPPDPDYSNYLNYVNFSDVVEESVGETELYYSFDWQGIHFVILDTVHEWNFDENNYTCPEDQMDWLLYDFANNALEFIIVTFHYPMYSVMPDNPDWWAQATNLRETFNQLFIDNGVDIVFNGHAHHYYRTQRDGILYVVTGGGGEPIAGVQTEGTDYQMGDVVFSGNHYCVCSINDETNQLDVFVYQMDQTIIDEIHLDLPEVITPPPFPTEMAVMILGGAAIVFAVIVHFFRRRGRIDYKSITIID
ncbi:MAG: kelch repeat-containing protein [Candidatus Thorarchaeota archaeon]